MVPSAGLFILPEDATVLPISMIKSMLPGRWLVPFSGFGNRLKRCVRSGAERPLQRFF
jgi:hypothetical protein